MNLICHTHFVFNLLFDLGKDFQFSITLYIKVSNKKGGGRGCTVEGVYSRGCVEQFATRSALVRNQFHIIIHEYSR